MNPTTFGAATDMKMMGYTNSVADSSQRSRIEQG
jgi:hypothetical protein